MTGRNPSTGESESEADTPLSAALQNAADHTAIYNLQRCLPQTVREFLRYLIAGTSAFLVDLAVLATLTEGLQVNYLLANVAGFCLGSAVSYTLCVGWVFTTRRLQCVASELGIFLLVGLIGLAANELSLWALVDGAGLHYALAKIGATGVVFSMNFALRKMILFR